MRFARSVVIGQGLILAAWGLAFCLRPREMAMLTGTLLMDAVSIGHMRAWLGGLPLGLAAFLFWSQRDPERIPGALVLLCCSMGALAATRLAAMLSGGVPVGYDLLYLLGWLLGAGVSAAALYGLREKPASVRPRARVLPNEPPQPFRRGDGDLSTH